MISNEGRTKKKIFDSCLKSDFIGNEYGTAIIREKTFVKSIDNDFDNDYKDHHYKN